MGRAIRWTLLVIALLTAVAIAVPFLVPVSSFIPTLALIAADKLGQPVAIAQLRLHALPTPRMVARDIRVGRQDDIRIGELEIVPDLLSILFGTRTVRLIRAEGVELKESALSIPKRIPKGDAGGEPVLVERILLQRVHLSHPVVKLPQFDLDIELGDAFRLHRAALDSRDGALKVKIHPKGDGGLSFVLEARDWTLPAGAPLRFDALTARGELKGAQLRIEQMEGRLYGGAISAVAAADWTRQIQVAGKATIAGVDVVPVQKALGKQPKLAGRVKSQVTFSARALSAGELMSALALDGPFELLGGSYQGVDLSKVADLSGKSLGDATQFEEFQGKLELRGEQVKIDGLCVRSPKVVAGGRIEIASDRTLSGRLDVSITKTGGFVGVPVMVAGTSLEPSLRPTKGYMIGALVGTVLLPGIGTGIGASAGGALEGKAPGGCK